FGRTSVSGPACVADSVGAIQRLQTDSFLQVAQLAFSPPHLQGIAAAIAGHCDAGRVVSAILQAAQAIQDYRYNPLFPHVTNYSAHKGSFSYLVNRFYRIPFCWDASILAWPLFHFTLEALVPHVQGLAETKL